MPSFMRNSIDVVSSVSICTTRAKLWQYTWSIAPHEIDHGVDRMHAHRRKPAERRFDLLRAPRRRRQEQRVGIRHAGFDMLDRAELARLDAIAQLDHLRMEAAIVADADRAPGLAHGVERGFGLLLGEGERLLAKDVLAGGRGGLDLLADGRRRASPAPPRRSSDRRAPPRSSRAMRSECCLAKASTSGVTVRVCTAVKRIRSLPRQATRPASCPTCPIRRWPR